jgi:hypothetical protein
MPASPDHLNFMNCIVNTLQQKYGKGVGALFLQYGTLTLSCLQPYQKLTMICLLTDLAPTHQYPHQLKQSVALVKYVMNQLGYKPSKASPHKHAGHPHLLSQN